MSGVRGFDSLNHHFLQQDKEGLLMKTMGTKEAKDIIYMNDGIRIGGVVCRACKDGYKIVQNGNEVMRTSKINLALDWLAEEGYLYETRFRLTAEQKDNLRKEIFNAIFCCIGFGISLAIALILTLAWLMGIGC